VAITADFSVKIIKYGTEHEISFIKNFFLVV